MKGNDMTGLEKIIEDIRTESREAAEAVLRQARSQAAAVAEEAEAEARTQCERIERESAARIAEAGERTRSTAELQRRRALLSAKQELISEVMLAAKQAVRELPAEKYFALILKMSAAAAHGGERGEIRFSESDRKRLPADFAERLKKLLPAGAELSVSERPAEIESGFLLDYDGVEENGSFDAVFAEKREQLQDRIHRILF